MLRASTPRLTEQTLWAWSFWFLVKRDIGRSHHRCNTNVLAIVVSATVSPLDGTPTHAGMLMTKNSSEPGIGGNLLLSKLPADEFNRIFPDPRLVALDFKHIVYEPRIPIDYAYFPVSGVISQLTITEDGALIELATIGNEGMVGLPLAFGLDESSSKAVVQVPSRVLRIASSRLKAEITRDSPLRRLLLRYAGVFLFQISQGAACNGLHSVQQRCCRWLLMTHDRVEGDEFPITHEFLSQMLGVRRPSITEVLRPLQDDQLIRHHRGWMMILNREGLENASCECYRTIHEEYYRTLGNS